jgi:hypothetical protein
MSECTEPGTSGKTEEPKFLLPETVHLYRQHLARIQDQNELIKGRMQQRADEWERTAERLEGEVKANRALVGKPAAMEIARRRADKDQKNATKLRKKISDAMEEDLWEFALLKMLPEDFDSDNLHHRLHADHYPFLINVATDEARKSEQQRIWDEGEKIHSSETDLSSDGERERARNKRFTTTEPLPTAWDKGKRYIIEYRKRFFLCQARHPAVLNERVVTMHGEYKEVYYTPNGRHKDETIVDFVVESLGQMSDEELNIVLDHEKDQ